MRKGTDYKGARNFEGDGKVPDWVKVVVTWLYTFARTHRNTFLKTREFFCMNNISRNLA